MPFPACFGCLARRVIAAALLVAAGSAAMAGAAPAPRPPEAIYARTCGYCHGQHVAPVIRGRKLPPGYIEQTVRAGPRAMPAFRPTEISSGELRALARWLNAAKADPAEHEQ